MKSCSRAPKHCENTPSGNRRRAVLSALSMMTSSDVVPGGRIWAFFGLTFVLTWIPQLIVLGAQRGLIAGGIERFMPLAALGVLGPMIAAIAFARAEPGGVRALFRPLGRWRVHPKWYLLALLLTGGSLALGLALAAFVFGYTGRWFFPPDDAQRITAMILVSFGEEIGWRGYALPRMQARQGALAASLWLGAAWAAWHLPMFVLAGVSLEQMFSMLPFFMAGSVLFTWIYYGSGGSLLLAVFAHMGSHLNSSHRTLPADATPLLVHTLVLVLLAAWCATRRGGIETPPPA